MENAHVEVRVDDQVDDHLGGQMSEGEGHMADGEDEDEEEEDEDEVEDEYDSEEARNNFKRYF